LAWSLLAKQPARVRPYFSSRATQMRWRSSAPKRVLVSTRRSYISARLKPHLTDRARRPSGTNNLIIAGTGGRERSDCEPTLTHSIYTDARLRGGWITKLGLLGLAALGVGYIARARRSPTRGARALHRG
jgi:hypothetical protein